MMIAILDDTYKNRPLRVYFDYCPTLRTGGGVFKVSEGECEVMERIRKITPKECWRFMGFDDENFEKAAEVNSDSQLYKQAGNSIVVNVLEQIINKLGEKYEEFRTE